MPIYNRSAKMAPVPAEKEIDSFKIQNLDVLKKIAC